MDATTLNSVLPSSSDVESPEVCTSMFLEMHHSDRRLLHVIRCSSLPSPCLRNYTLTDFRGSYKRCLIFFKQRFSSIILISLCLVTQEIDYMVKSCFLILAASVVDVFDGKIARKLGTSGSFGKQIDSIADLPDILDLG